MVPARQFTVPVEASLERKTRGIWFGHTLLLRVSTVYRSGRRSPAGETVTKQTIQRFQSRVPQICPIPPSAFLTVQNRAKDWQRGGNCAPPGPIAAPARHHPHCQAKHPAHLALPRPLRYKILVALNTRPFLPPRRQLPSSDVLPQHRVSAQACRAPSSLSCRLAPAVSIRPILAAQGGAVSFPQTTHKHLS
jgi:hypothetical protein